MRTRSSRLPVRSPFPTCLSSLLLVVAVGSSTPGAAQPNVFNIPVSAEDGAAGDLFACALALSDEGTLVVGSVLDGDEGDELAVDSGSLYVFRRRGGAFERTAKLLAMDAAAGHRLGFSVAVDPTGARLAAGAIFHDAAGQNAGAAYVFRREGGGWVEEARLVPDGLGAFDQLGHSVALDGDMLAAGAPGDDTRDDAAGTVYVFERVEPGGGAGGWALAARLVADDGAGGGGNVVGDGLGFAVALDGDTLLAGAPFADDGLGAVHVFERGPGGWREVQRLTAAERRAGALFGAAVALDGDRAVVGARLDGEAGEAAGAAWTFRRVAGVWELESQLQPGQAAGDELGISVALDGNALAVGSRFDDEVVMDSGAVYHYRFEGGEWRLQGRKLKALEPGEGDELGFAVAVEDRQLEQDDLVIAGAYRTDTEAGEDAGLAWLRVEARNADLAVSKTDNRASAAVGDRLTYTIRATNRGPADVAGARVTDTFPAGLTGCTWSCTSNGGGATCDTPPPAAGVTSTELDALVSLPAATSVTFRVTCTVAGSALCTTVRNRVRIEPPDDVLEIEEGDNVARDATRVGFSAVTVTKEAPETVAPGGTVTDTIIVSNEGLCPAIEVQVTDEHGAGDPRTDCTWTCDGASCPTATGTGTVATTLLGLSADAQATFEAACTVPDTVPAGTDLCDTATAVGPDNSATASACTRVVDTGEPDLAVRLEVTDPGGPDPEIEAGGAFTVRATVENVGEAPAESVTLVLALDPPLAPTSLETITVSPSGSCDGADLTCSLPDLAPGETAVVEATFRTTPTGCDALDLLDLEISAQVASVPADLDPTNNHDSAGVRVTPTAVTDCPVDLRVVKSVASSQIQVGGVVAFTVVVRNAGPETAVDAAVEDLIPNGLLAATAAWTCEPSDGAFCTLEGEGDLVDVVTLPPGGTATYTLTAEVTAGTCGTLTNLARVQARSPNVELEPGDNFDSVTFLALPTVGTCATKTVAPKIQVPGGQVVYTIQIVHAGPGVFGGPGPELEDTIPSDLAVVSATADRGLASVMGNLVTWDGTLQPGEAVVITVVATVDAGDPGQEICNQGLLPDPQIPTDDPELPGLEDPTCFVVVTFIPTLSPALLLLMAALLAALALRRLRWG